MPRLPDLTDLGARPTPQNRGGIVQQQAVGAVGRAVQGLGQSIAGAGSAVAGVQAEKREKDDRLAYATAKTAYLKADVTTRQELENDPDYGTYEARYTEKMTAARGAVGKLIRSPYDRSMFEADADLDMQRGLGDVRKAATGKRVTAERATMFTALDELQDVGRSAPDEATRAAVIQNSRELIEAGVGKGLIDADDAGELRRKWASDYVTQQVSSAILREDYDAAKSIYDANAKVMDWRSALSLGGDLKRMGDDRQATDDAMGSAPGFVAPVKGVPAGKGQPSFGNMVKAIATQESGGQHFGKDGKPKTSSAGAIGVMQVMPGTAPEAAKLAGLPYDENRYRNDPAYNKALGEAYFGEMLRKFGDPVIAAAAYNAGPGAVNKALKKGDGWLATLPAETQDYVAKFQKRTGYAGGAPANAERPIDKESWYANIDQRANAEGWTPERIERAKSVADREVARADQFAARRIADANDAAADVAIGLGDKFTNTAAIPRDVWNTLPATDRARLENMAEANRRPVEPLANGETATKLEIFERTDPAGFARVDLTKYAGQMTRAEMQAMRIKQAEIKTGGGDQKQVSSRSNITSFIGFKTKLDGDLAKVIETDGKKANADTRQRYLRIYTEMERYVAEVTQGRRDPTDAELQAGWNRATQAVIVDGERVERYKVEPGERFAVEVPIAARTKIIETWRATGNPGNPPDGTIGSIYLKYKGKPGYWN